MIKEIVLLAVKKNRIAIIKAGYLIILGLW